MKLKTKNILIASSRKGKSKKGLLEVEVGKSKEVQQLITDHCLKTGLVMVGDPQVTFSPESSFSEGTCLNFKGDWGNIKKVVSLLQSTLPTAIIP